MLCCQEQRSGRKTNNVYVRFEVQSLPHEAKFTEIKHVHIMFCDKMLSLGICSFSVQTPSRFKSPYMPRDRLSSSKAFCIFFTMVKLQRNRGNDLVIPFYPSKKGWKINKVISFTIYCSLTWKVKYFHSYSLNPQENWNNNIFLLNARLLQEILFSPWAIISPWWSHWYSLAVCVSSLKTVHTAGTQQSKIK